MHLHIIFLLLSKVFVVFRVAAAAAEKEARPVEMTAAAARCIYKAPARYQQIDRTTQIQICMNNVTAVRCNYKADEYNCELPLKYLPGTLKVLSRRGNYKAEEYNCVLPSRYLGDTWEVLSKRFRFIYNATKLRASYKHLLVS